MITFTRHPVTGQPVYEVTCDGDPECLEASYQSGYQNLSGVMSVFRHYGWEVSDQSVQSGLVRAVCPTHTTNPPPAGYPRGARLGHPEFPI